MNYPPVFHFSGLGFVVWLALYIYIAYALQTMAKKTNTPNEWFAWIPLLNIFLLIKIAGKSYWWFLLLLIPLVNIVIAVYLWMKVAERCKKPGWVGLLIIIPVVNLFIPGYIAFTK